MASRTGADPTSLIANMNLKRGTSQAQALTGVDTRIQGERERFMHGALGTASGLTNTGIGREQAGVQGTLGLENQAYGMAGNLAQADETQKQAGVNRVMSLLQSAGQMYGAISGVPSSRKVGMPTERGGGGGDTMPDAPWGNGYDEWGYPVSTMPEGGVGYGSGGVGYGSPVQIDAGQYTPHDGAPISGWGGQNVQTGESMLPMAPPVNRLQSTRNLRSPVLRLIRGGY